MSLLAPLAKYDIDKEFELKVTRFYGADLANTDCSVIVNVGDYRSEYTLGFRRCPGDGTVPVESANERGDGLPLPGEHLALLSSEAFMSFLSELYAKNMSNLDAEYAKKTDTNLGPVELRVQLSQLIPPNPNPISEAEKTASDITTRTNEAAVQRRDELEKLPAGTSGVKIFKDASIVGPVSKMVVKSVPTTSVLRRS